MDTLSFFARFRSQNFTSFKYYNTGLTLVSIKKLTKFDFLHAVIIYKMYFYDKDMSNFEGIGVCLRDKNDNCRNFSKMFQKTADTAVSAVR